jgi:hypothetical protein
LPPPVPNGWTRVPVREIEPRHVLDDAEHRHVELPEHLDSAHRVEHGDVLRRGHDDGAGERNGLHHRELRVARTGRQIDEQHVELAPRDVLEELPHRRP